jgi:hypothetical protein
MENETPTIVAPAIEAPAIETEAIEAEPTPALVVQDDRLLQLINERLSAIVAPVAEESLVNRIAARVNMSVSTDTRKRWLNTNDQIYNRINEEVAEFVAAFFRDDGQPMLRAVAEERFNEWAPNLDAAITNHITSCFYPGDNRSEPFFQAIEANVRLATEEAIEQTRSAASAPQALQAATADAVNEAMAAAAAAAHPELADIQQRLDRIQQIEDARSAFSELLTIERRPRGEGDGLGKAEITVAEAPADGATDWSLRNTLSALNPAWTDGINAYSHYMSWDALHFLQQKENGGNNGMALTTAGALAQVLQLFEAIPQVQMIRTKQAHQHMVRHIIDRTRLGRHLLASGYRITNGIPGGLSRISGAYVIVPERNIDGTCTCEPDLVIDL